MDTRKKVTNLLDNKGMSLMDLIMALSLVGIVAVGIMHLSKNTTEIQTRNYISVDYAQLSQEFLFLLTQERHCTASLGGINLEIDPTDPDFINATLDPTKGIDVELFISDSTGTVVNKKLSGTDVGVNPGDTNFTRYGKLNITGIKLSMPDKNLGAFLPGVIQYQAEINIYSHAFLSAEKNATTGVSELKRKTLPVIKKNIILEFSTPAPHIIARCVALP